MGGWGVSRVRRVGCGAVLLPVSSVGQNISSYQILMGNTRYDQFYLVKCRTWYYPVVPDTTR